MAAFEQDTGYPYGGPINTWTVRLNQDPYCGWHRIVQEAWSIRTVWMDDSTWGTSKQWIGAAGMDFTCR